MRTIKFFLVIFLILSLSAAYAGRQQKMEKTFQGIKSIQIKTVSGDCTIITGKGKEVKLVVEYNVYPENAMTPEFRQSGSILRLKERWNGGPSRGNVIWKLTVPSETEVEFSSASGDLSVSGLFGDVESNTASGDVELSRMQGSMDIETASGNITIYDSKGELDFSAASGDIEADDITGEMELSVASGDIDISDCKGIFDVSTASGDIDADGITMTAMAEFSTASGDVDVQVAVTPEYDLEISTASGRSMLDLNGNAVKGTVQMTARKDRGRIVSDFSFQDEEEFERYGKPYIRKTFTKDGKTPFIRISTASGTATLKK